MPSAFRAPAPSIIPPSFQVNPRFKPNDSNQARLAGTSLTLRTGVTPLIASELVSCVVSGGYRFVSPSAQFKTIVGDCAAADASCARARMCCPSALTSKISPSASGIKI